MLIFILMFMKFDIEAKHRAGLKCMMSLVQKIDNYVSEDVVKDPNCGVLKLKPAEDDVDALCDSDDTTALSPNKPKGDDGVEQEHFYDPVSGSGYLA
ncbi:hypothetical protein AALO_G00262630 [Alosa alosa]|uniref:Uncharacterized protein n=1 Tax=Alosa alosa TaxID=278164 RepID=A0AAV6FVC7_9TELE|nr:hypothetical protein AALO_G00262630 [Alosa alosa]